MWIQALPVAGLAWDLGNRDAGSAFSGVSGEKPQVGSRTESFLFQLLSSALLSVQNHKRSNARLCNPALCR